jgi:hypothetical protein
MCNKTILREELKAAFQIAETQPESLDEKPMEIAGEQNAVVQMQHSLVLRTEPLRSIKAAAEAKIGL